MMVRVLKPMRDDNGYTMPVGTTFTIPGKDKARYRDMLELGILQDVETVAVRMTLPQYGRKWNR